MDDYIEQAKASAEQKADQEAEEAILIAEERKKAASCAAITAEKRKAGPLFIEDAVIGQSAISLPQINMNVSNNSISTVEAFDFEVQCFTAFDTPVKSAFGKTACAGACTHRIRLGDETHMSMQLSLHGGTAKAKILITRAKSSAGEVCTQTEEQPAATPGAMFTATTPK